MSKEEKYLSKDGKGYLKLTYYDVEITPEPTTLEGQITELKKRFKFADDEPGLQILIQRLIDSHEN
jgi:hypothetical protein